eukprot:8574024-Alexandrium_andersonii.AAC.1
MRLRPPRLAPGEAAHCPGACRGRNAAQQRRATDARCALRRLARPGPARADPRPPDPALESHGIPVPHAAQRHRK